MSDLFGSASETSLIDPDGQLPRAIELELVVHDRDVIRALVEHADEEQRNQFALEALKIGVLALRHVSGRATADLIQREVHAMQKALDSHNQTVQSQLSEKLKEYFDLKDGRFSQRVQGLVADDGELARLIKKLIDGENSPFAQTLMAHVGRESPLMKQLDPEHSAGLLATLRQTVDQQLTRQRDHVLHEFSLDNKDGALSRLVFELTMKHGDFTNAVREKIDEVLKEFSLDKPDSAMNRLVTNVATSQHTITSEFSLDNDKSALARLKGELMTVLEAHVQTNAEFQSEVKTTLRELVVRREEQARTTEHGKSFQRVLFDFLQGRCAPSGDIAEFVGDNVGAIANCKKGDVLIQLGNETAAPGARIVFEAKEDKEYTLMKALDEIEVARKNRHAQIGVFVFSSKASPDRLTPISRHGCDIAVIWDADDPLTDSFLWAALDFARLMCFRAQQIDDSSICEFESIERLISNIERRAANLNAIRKHAVTAQLSAKKISSATGKIIRRVDIDRKAFDRQVMRLRKNVAELKEAINPQSE